MGRLNLYRNISITFIVFAAMILCAIFLLFYSQATIVIGSDSQVVNLNFVADIITNSSGSTAQDTIKGAVISTTTKISMTFDTASTKTAVASELVGRVKLINESSKDQRLVRTTQLQASNGVIVRTDRDVTVPAGGSIEVNVFPKEPDKFENITSGRLVIIMLWEQLQPVIYGEVIEELSKKTAGEEIYFLAESDVNLAKKKILEEVIKKVDAEERGNIFGELVNYQIDKKIGDETKLFNVEAEVKLSIVEPKEDELRELVAKKAEKMDLNGFKITNIDLDQVKFSILDNSKDDKIIVKISYSLNAYLTEDNEILDKYNFTNKTAQEIKNWAGQTGVIKEVETIISPYWRDTTPKDPKRIKLIIN